MTMQQVCPECDALVHCYEPTDKVACYNCGANGGLDLDKETTS
jgi:hypothetical protein